MIDTRYSALAVIATVTATALFTVQDAILKLNASTYPAGQIIIVRGLAGSAFVFIVVLVSGHAVYLRSIFAPRLLARSCFDVIAMFTFLRAIQDLPLAITSTFLNATPLVATGMIAALGLEKVRFHGWLATSIGFGGILLIVRPDVTHLQPAVAYALLGTFALSARDVVTRTVSNDIPTSIATLSTTVVVCLSGLVLVVLGGREQNWLQLDHGSAAQLLLAGVIVTAGNLAAIWAYRAAEVSLVSPFRYCAILWALAAGYVLFGDWPDMTAMIGILLVAGAGVFTIVSRSVRRTC